MTALDVDTWRQLVDAARPPTVEQVAAELAGARDLGRDQARDRVEAALDGDGPLTFDPEAGTFGEVVLEGDATEKTPESGDVEGCKDDETPTPDAPETGKDDPEDGKVSKYRRVYRAAAERAGREPWEYVEEDAIREALAEIGFESLLDTGQLFEIRGWRVADVSDDDEDPRRRWYYPSEKEPRPDEFRRFHELLTDAAPDDYTPHYFRVRKASKDPATQYGSWKTEDARLTVEEAVKWMKQGGNVGIAGTPDDALVNGDIDDDEETTPTDVPTSLRAISRSRTGWHTWYFDEDDEVPNIPTDEYGEIRTDWQYVVAPGSFVASTAEEIPDDATDPGYYTIVDEEPVARIGYDDLPKVFHEAAEAAEPAEDPQKDASRDFEPDTTDTSGQQQSAVYDVEAADLTTKSDPTQRFTSIFHNSSTGANMSVSGNKLHCWRHGVAHGGLQALATLSSKTANGCKELGAAHKNSGAGRNRLKGDWQLVWAAWHEAKQRGAIPNDDPIPYRVLVNLATDEGALEEEDLVVRDADTGEVVDEDHDGDTYRAFPDAGAYADALEHVRNTHDVDPGREIEVYDDSEKDETDGRHLLELDVVVEPANALAAAEAVEPDDLDQDLPELARDDIADVAIAVALAEGWIATPDEFPGDGRYTEAYYRARDRYGAPLPKYLDNSTLEEREDLVFAALERVNATHVLDTCRSEVTVEEPAGKALAKLNPTWEDSDSGERILAGYGRGFYCVEHEVSFSPIQLVALEHELINSEDAYPRGEAFKQAYRRLREEYDAPLPKWRATLLEHVAVLPPAARVVDGKSADQSLGEAREATEALIRDAASVRNRAQLVTVVPGGGKTYSAIKQADDQPVLYLAGRNELKQQAEEYADETGVSSLHLPILAENTIDDSVIEAAVGAVRDDGRGLLRKRETLLDRVGGLEDDDEADEEDEDEVELDRATCPVADGEHGDAWALAVQTARALGIRPADIHRHDSALFGDQLPCQDGGDCPYNSAWDTVRNPETSADVLIGSPGHAYVDSATTYFDRGPDGDRVEIPRAVVLDEFPGDEYIAEYDDRALDHATWLSDALVGVNTREDLLAAGLDTDTWVSLWLDGDGEEYGKIGDLMEVFQAGASLVDAREAAADLLDSGALDRASTTSARLPAVRDALGTLVDDGPTDGDLAGVRDILARANRTIGDDADRAYATDGDAGALYTLAEEVDKVLTPLVAALDHEDDRPLADQARDLVDAVPVGGDLRGLLEDAIAVLRDGDGPDGLLDAAVAALRGGRDGCRTLAIYADDGYAHPDAWALLAGAIAQDTTEVETGAFAFDNAVEGGTFKRLKQNDATIVADKDHHGVLVADQPAFTDITGGKCPVLGLDATGRTELWRLAIGRDTQRRDIHDTDAERRGFLRNAMSLRVVQTADTPLAYHGNPEGKHFGEDLELVRTVAEEYTGADPDALTSDKPAVISTLKVLEHLGDDLADHASDMVNYENMKGSDALGERQVACILGSQHYGDAVPEKWGLLAGEDAGRGDTRGNTLDYGSDVANAYLRYMREDHTMQAILRAGRNDDDTVVFAHTAALRDDLPVDAEGAVLSAHSRGTLAVAEAAKEFTTQPFTASQIVEAIAEDDRAVGQRQVQNVLADLRESGYIRTVEEGSRGRAYEYELEEDPGLADVEIPQPDETETPVGQNEKTANGALNTWNFVFDEATEATEGMIPPSRPTIPAGDTGRVVSDGLEPPS